MSYFLVVTYEHDETQRKVHAFHPGRREGYEDIFRFSIEELKEKEEKYKFLPDTRDQEAILASKYVEGRIELDNGDFVYGGVPGSLLFTSKERA